MELRAWLTASHTSIKAFARDVKVERAMIYRYFLGTVPRARVIRRIEILTEGAVSAQDFYANAVRRMDSQAAMACEPASIAIPEDMLAAGFAQAGMDHAVARPASMT